MPKCIANEMGEVVLNEEMSIVDVYDLASEIGIECEKIIEKYGTDSVKALIPKVINALELLEALTSRYECDNSRVQELNDHIALLESEKTEKAEYRKRFEKELEHIEEQWRTESRELMVMVDRLQEENRRLSSKLQQSTGNQTQNRDMSAMNSSIELLSPQTPDKNTEQIIQLLRKQINEQRNDIKLKDRLLMEKSAENDNQSLQLDRLKTSGRESRRRLKIFQNQVRTLCKERAGFLTQIQEQHREIIALKRKLGIAEKENEDYSKIPPEQTFELKESLEECDKLKTKVRDLEDELKVYKQFESERSNSCQQLTKEFPSISSSMSLQSIMMPSPIDEDPPVQGPLPFEPDDAPWKKASESGIRKFFRKLFSETASASFPHRSLSSLSKVAMSSGSTDTSI